MFAVMEGLFGVGLLVGSLIGAGARRAGRYARRAGRGRCLLPLCALSTARGIRRSADPSGLAEEHLALLRQNALFAPLPLTALDRLAEGMSPRLVRGRRDRDAQGRPGRRLLPHRRRRDRRERRRPSAGRHSGLATASARSRCCTACRGRPPPPPAPTSTPMRSGRRTFSQRSRDRPQQPRPRRLSRSGCAGPAHPDDTPGGNRSSSVRRRPHRGRNTSARRRRGGSGEDIHPECGRHTRTDARPGGRRDRSHAGDRDHGRHCTERRAGGACAHRRRRRCTRRVCRLGHPVR